MLFRSVSQSRYDGVGGITEITSIDITANDGKLTMDALNLQQKVYNMLNRIAVSGGTYRDWLETVYTAGSGAGGQASASGAGKQQLIHDRTTPIDIAQITVAAAQAKKLEAEADNLNADKVVKEQQILKLGEEVEKVKQETLKIKGETALQGWAQRQLMTISDSELNSFSKGQGWTKGWSEGSSQGTSQSESKQGGGSVGVSVLKSGGNISGNYGYSESESQNTSENKSQNEGADKSESKATSTSGRRQVLVWPKSIVTGKQIGRAHV